MYLCTYISGSELILLQAPQRFDQPWGTIPAGESYKCIYIYRVDY